MSAGLFDFGDEEEELVQLVAGAVDKDKGGDTGDSAHVGQKTGSQPTGIKRGLDKTSAKNSKRAVCRKGAHMQLKRTNAVEPMLVQCIFERCPVRGILLDLHPHE